MKRFADAMERLGQTAIHWFYLWSQLVGKPMIKTLGYCPDCCTKLEPLPEVEAYPGYFEPGEACPKCNAVAFQVRRGFANRPRGGI